MRRAVAVLQVAHRVWHMVAVATAVHPFLAPGGRRPACFRLRTMADLVPLPEAAGLEVQVEQAQRHQLAAMGRQES